MDIDTSSSPCYISAEPFLTTQGIKNGPHPQAKVLPHQTEHQHPLLTCQVWDTHRLCLSQCSLSHPWWERFSAEERADNFNHHDWWNLFYSISYPNPFLSSSLLQALSGSSVNHLVYAWKRMRAYVKAINYLFHLKKIKDATVGFALIAIAPLVGCRTC